jgi:hypothetical protein
MKFDSIPINLARRVTPQVLRTYAESLGWRQTPNINGKVVVYHRPDSPAHQVSIPLDDTFDDYAKAVGLAVARLAEYEKQPVGEVLDRLLLPSSDLLLFRDTGPEAEDGTLPLTQVVELVTGAKKALLAQAHSIAQPSAFHSRLGRADAEQFVNACRFGQTQRVGFAIALACPLDAVPDESSLFARQPAFTRRVTTALMENLGRMVEAAEQNRADDLLRRDLHPLLSANLCEAIVQLRPPNDRPSLTVSARWSLAAPVDSKRSIPAEVRLTPDAFAVAEHLASRLRAAPTPEPNWYVGYVDVLRGQPGADGRPAGEVLVTIVQGDEVIRTWMNLSEQEYQVAKATRRCIFAACCLEPRGGNGWN